MADDAAKKPAAKKPAAKKAAAKPATSKKPAAARNPKDVVLLSGGNPQITKADGDAPVQAYIAAMPEWKSDVGRRLDALIEQALPGVRKAVRWNSPFYGLEGMGWIVSYHCFTKYVKVTFLNGTTLDPLPPGPSKDPDTRYLDIHEDGELDEAQFVEWVKQAGARPGWDGFQRSAASPTAA